MYASNNFNEMFTRMQFLINNFELRKRFISFDKKHNS